MAVVSSTTAVVCSVPGAVVVVARVRDLVVTSVNKENDMHVSVTSWL